MFPLQAAYYRQPLPHVAGFPVLRVLRVDPTPCRPLAVLYVRLSGLLLIVSFSLYSRICVNRRKRRVLRYIQFDLLGRANRVFPSSCNSSTYMPGSRTPTDPRESCHYRFLCVGFHPVNDVAICINITLTELNVLQEGATSLWPICFPVYASYVLFDVNLL
jgi:hypothetical protein